ncbi:hypothetical protein IT157_09210, partial [bacterium]|nr:hypothetical protein [bacterium]
NMISSGEVSAATTQMGDWRMLMAFGTEATNGFTIRPGETLPLTLAFIAGSDTADVGRNAEWALAMYLNDFQGPSAPDVPVFDVDVYPDMVRIKWESNAEASVDAITGLADFEGYTIERKTGQTDWQKLAVFDRIDTLQIPFEWENFNLGMPDSAHTVYLDTLGNVDYYFYEDRNLIPGQTYEYVVRAFDTGVLGAGILYSGRTGNTQTVTIAAQGGGGLTSGKLSDVYVYPNPYKGSHSGEQLPIVSNGQNLFVRQLYFRGLPTDGSSTIRIYTLGGDYINKIEHDGSSEQTRWDLMTRNGQEIASGIYYFTVEHGSDMFIDKFVVIK